MNDAKKIAWIIGGSGGIVLSSGLELAKAGFTVILASRTEDALRASVGQVEALGGQASYVVMDAMEQRDVASKAAGIVSRYGRIDVLVNSAGFNVAARRWEELRAGEFERVISGNLTGTFYAVEAVLPTMRAQRCGTIVNIASIAGKVVT